MLVEIKREKFELITFVLLSDVFWSLSALQIAKVSGDYDWLAQRLLFIELAAEYLIELIQPNWNLVAVPGSLFIDVFIRNNFTSDSNAAVPHLLQEVSFYEVTEIDKFNDTHINVYRSWQ